MPEEKRKINAWIPVSLYNKLESAGYDNITQALIKALESFREDTQEDITGYIQDIEGYKQDIEGYKQDIEGYKQDIEGYKQDLSRIQKDLDKQNQDIIGYIQDIRILQTRSEEQERHISFLKEVMEKAGQREEDLKQLHNNYMLQIQSLINARALMPSGSTEGEKPKQESKPAREKKESGYPEKEERLFDMDIEDSPAIKESPDIEHEVKPEVKQGDKDHWKEKEATIKKTCKNCLQPFLAKNPKNEYCSPKCRTAFNRRK